MPFFRGKVRYNSHPGKRQLCLGYIGRDIEKIIDRKGIDSLWVYLYEEGVEPTNNLAEQDVRRGVIWRKISNGTQSEAGERFVERILTVGMTLKKQSKSVLDFLVESFQSYIRAGPMPMPI